jgi:hypothetical protein
VAVWFLEMNVVTTFFLRNYFNLMTFLHSANTSGANTASTYFSLVKMHTGTVAIVSIPNVHVHTKITGHLTRKELFSSTLQTNIAVPWK